jgi:hypothetical protein
MLSDFKISFFVNSYADKLFGKRKGRLVHHHGCRCMEEQWTWDGGKRERRRRVELRWREEGKMKTWLSGGECGQS